jgi:hypothetical protein
MRSVLRFEDVAIDRRLAAHPTARRHTDGVSDPPATESRPFICPHCDGVAHAVVRGAAYWRGSDASQGPPVEYALLQCDECYSPILEAREDYGGGFAEDTRPAQLYPSSQRLSPRVPAGLRREWDEANTCFRAKAYAACTVMVRRTVEGACADQGVTERTLAKSLKRMAADGLMDSTLAEWAEALRIVGNKGAHYTGKAVSREDAEDALAFAEALLDHIYVLRSRFQDFRKRLNA